MFKSFILKTAAIFGQKQAEQQFFRVTEDKYDTYGISQVLHKKSVDESAEWAHRYIDSCLFFSDKRRMFSHVKHQILKSDTSNNLLFLEFGVQTGTSINFFSADNSHPFYGFDTFVGMPEEWLGWNVEKGQFSMNGTLPKVNDNVTLIKGLIQETLPLFLDKHQDKKIGFIHIDTDTYAAAKIILRLCKSRLVSGSLILFDELHSYISWKQHEFKALQEELPESSYIFKAFSDRKQGLIELV